MKPTLNALFFYLSFCAVVVGLSACDVSSALTPPVTSNNLLGFEATTITLTMGTNPPEAANAQAIQSQMATGSAAPILRSFNDLSPLQSDPKSLYLELTLADRMELITPEDHPNCDFELLSLTIDVSLADGSQSLKLPQLSLNQRVKLSPVGDGNSYRIVSENTVLSAKASAAEVEAFVNLITTGGINTLEAVVATAAFSVPDIPAGSQLSFSIITDQGTFSF